MFKVIKLGLMKKGIVTTKYPFKAYKPFDNTKGASVIDIKKCTHIGECAKQCPVNAIKVESDGITIDMGTCIFCGACVDACPNGAIKMSKEIELSSRKRDNLKVKF